MNFFITLFTALIFVSCQSRSENKEQIEIIDKTIPSKKSAAIDNSKNLKEKVLLDYIISASSIQPNSKNGTPFDKLDYDKIIAYDFEGSESLPECN